MIDNPDITAWRREYAVLAIDGAISQADAAARFLSLGEDRFAVAAFQRAVDFMKLAAGEINSLRDELALGQDAA